MSGKLLNCNVTKQSYIIAQWKEQLRFFHKSRSIQVHGAHLYESYHEVDILQLFQHRSTIFLSLYSNKDIVISPH